MASQIEHLLDAAHIGVLLAVEETGSFSEAAVRLGISQPAVSQSMKRLEGSTGRKLFRRAGRGIELTSDGEAVVVYSRAMLSLSHDLRRQLRQTVGSTHVRIGMSDDFLRTALPTVLSIFIRAHPHVELRCMSGTYDTLAAAIENKTVDLCVMRRYKEFPNTRTLWTDELVWNGALDYEIPDSDPVPLVLPIAPNPAREAPIEALRAAGRTWSVRFESLGLLGIEAALQAGLGVCAGPRTMPLHGAGPLRPGHGLPSLPDAEFVMVGPSARATPVHVAFGEILSYAAASRFALDTL